MQYEPTCIVDMINPLHSFVWWSLSIVVVVFIKAIMIMDILVFLDKNLTVLKQAAQILVWFWYAQNLVFKISSFL
jgi:hypothetical protein